MNTAARLQQACPPNSILLSEACVKVLEELSREEEATFYGTVTMKGLGAMPTYVFLPRSSKTKRPRGVYSSNSGLGEKRKFPSFSHVKSGNKMVLDLLPSVEKVVTP